MKNSPPLKALQDSLLPCMSSTTKSTFSCRFYYRSVPGGAVGEASTPQDMEKWQLGENIDSTLMFTVNCGGRKIL